MVCPLSERNYSLPTIPSGSCRALRRLTEAIVLTDNGGTLLRDRDSGLPAQDLPTWVDTDLVRRGQRVFLKLGRPLFSSMMVSLILGCRISRFADVLLHSPGGYCGDALQTFRRFRDTAMHILCWISHDLFDHQSPARKSLSQVRAMHVAARMRVQALGRCSIGAPVSQYDLAIVLLAFSGMAVDYVKNEFGFAELSQHDIAAYIHLWRYIGWLLGIHDDYNPCASVSLCSDLLADLYLVSNLDANENEIGDSGQILYHSILKSFGKFGIGLGPTVTRALPCVGLTKAGFTHPAKIPKGVRYLEVYLLIGLLSRRVPPNPPTALHNLPRKLGLNSAREPTWLVMVFEALLLAKGLMVEYLTFPLLALLLGGRGSVVAMDYNEDERLRAYEKWRGNFSELVLDDRDYFFPSISFYRPETISKIFLILDASSWILFLGLGISLFIYAVFSCYHYAFMSTISS